MILKFTRIDIVIYDLYMIFEKKKKKNINIFQ